MKEIDVNFFSKIKVINPGFYDKKMNNAKTCNEFVEKEITLTEKARRVFSVKCMTVNEKRDYLLSKTEEYFREHKKMPFAKYKIPESRFGLGSFLSRVRCGIIKLTEIQNKRLLDLDTKFFTLKIKRINIDRIVQELIKFYKEKQRMPSLEEKIVLKDLGEINLGTYWTTIKSNKNKSFTDQHRQLILKEFPNAFNHYQEVVDKCIEFLDSKKRLPYCENDKIQMYGKEYSIGKTFTKIQRNPEKHLWKNLTRQLEEKDPLWRLGLAERKILKKLEKCFDFFNKNNSNWPKQCEENKNHPLDLEGGEDGKIFDIGVFWNNVKSGATTISESSYQEIIQLDSTLVINKKRKRGDISQN
jgi:hypothetical protein